MALDPSQATIDDLQSQVDTLNSNLDQSPTAFASNVTPTASDVAAQRKLISTTNALNKTMSNYNKAQWANTDTGNTTPVDNPDDAAGRTNVSYVQRFLHALSVPMHAGVGVVQSALGKGPTDSLVGNVQSAVKNDTSYGDVLRSEGVNSGLSGVLGFGLDVALDPVNWATMGTEALVPRVGYGIAKAGLEGGEAALTSGILGKIKTLATPLKWVGGDDLYANLAARVGKSVANYEALTGDTVEKLLSNQAAGNGDILSKIGGGIGKGVEYLKQNPTMEKVIDSITYDPGSWLQKQKVIEEMNRARAEAPTALTASSPEELNQMVMAKVGSSDVPGGMSKEFEDKMNQLDQVNLSKPAFQQMKTSDILNEGAQAAVAAPAVSRAIDTNSIPGMFGQEAQADLQLKKAVADWKARGYTDEDISQVIAKTKEAGADSGQTGVKWFDDAMKGFKGAFKIGDTAIGGKIIDAYKSYISLFRSLHIGNPASMVIAALSNQVMSGMAGRDITSLSRMEELLNAKKIIFGNPNVKSLRDLILNPEWRSWTEKYPELFKSVFGIRPGAIFDQPMVERAIDDYAAAKNLSPELVSQAKTNAYNKITEILRSNGGIDDASLKPFSAIDPNKSLLDTTYMSKEYSGTYFVNMMKGLDKAGKDGNLAAKAVFWSLNAPLKTYVKIDQVQKLGEAMDMVNNGLAKSELTVMKRWAHILPEDLTFVPETGKYKVSVDKAVQISDSLQMNYAAMPAAVKVLRSLPFFGMPFSSFAFGMLSKTGQAAMYNPAFFNKVASALNEINGGRSPLEKLALKSPYYQWYNEQGMVSLPFFRQNPVYLNLAPFIPYYTMNIFEPTQRRYEDTLGGNAAKLVDELPILKTPEGRVLTDYFIIPHLLSQTNPTNSFDQPLYPKDATAIDKVGYALRAEGEAFTSPLWGAAGLVTPTSIAKYIPAYRWRQMSYAKAGQNPEGVQTSENPVQKTARAMLAAYGGMSLYPMNITGKSNSLTPTSGQ